MFAEKQGEMGWKMVKSRQVFTQKSIPRGSGWLGWHKAVLATEAGLGEGQMAALCLPDVGTPTRENSGSGSDKSRLACLR